MEVNFLFPLGHSKQEDALCPPQDTWLKWVVVEVVVVVVFVEVVVVVVVLVVVVVAVVVVVVVPPPQASPISATKINHIF